MLCGKFGNSCQCAMVSCRQYTDTVFEIVSHEPYRLHIVDVHHEVCREQCFLETVSQTVLLVVPDWLRNIYAGCEVNALPTLMRSVQSGNLAATSVFPKLHYTGYWHSLWTSPKDGKILIKCFINIIIEFHFLFR